MPMNSVAQATTFYSIETPNKRARWRQPSACQMGMSTLTCNNSYKMFVKITILSFPHLATSKFSSHRSHSTKRCPIRQVAAQFSQRLMLSVAERRFAGTLQLTVVQDGTIRAVGEVNMRIRHLLSSDSLTSKIRVMCANQVRDQSTWR